MPPISGKKVALVITKSNWGGAQSYVHTLARGLAGAGADVVVLAGGTGTADAQSGVLFERLAEEGARTVFLSGFMRDISLVHEIRAFWQLVRVLRRERPDVLHLNSSKAGGIGALAGRVAGIRRIVFTAHGWAHREPRSMAARALIWLASFLTIALSSRVIVVSEQDAKDAPALFMGWKLSLVHNGLRRFELADRDAVRTHLGLAANAVSIVMNAELHTNKGQDIAIRALAHLGDRAHRASLILVGDGEDRASLEALARACGVSERVRFLGFVPNAKHYLSGADIYLMPSRKEGFPFSLLEAGLAALPVIATRTGGIPEIIRDGLTGALIPPENPVALAETLGALIDDSRLRTRLGTALKELTERSFSEEVMVEKTVQAYLR